MKRTQAAAVKPARRTKPASRRKPRIGRPPKYDPAKLPRVYELATRNQPDIVIARRVFGCCRQVLVEWKTTYPALADTIRRGKAEYWDTAVPEVEDSLVRSAVGKYVIEEGVKTMKDGTTKTYKVYAPPVTLAQIFTLCNRKAFDKSTNPNGWRNVQRVEVEGEIGGPRPIVFVVERGTRKVALDGSAAIVAEGPSGNGRDGPKALEAENTKENEDGD